MNKMKNLKSKNESRVIFDYFRIHEDLSKIHLKLFSKIHDNLSNSRHECLFVVDLKHAYLIISLHSNDKHYFAFTISNIDQMQSTRIQ